MVGSITTNKRVPQGPDAGTRGACGADAAFGGAGVRRLLGIWGCAGSRPEVRSYRGTGIAAVWRSGGLTHAWRRRVAGAVIAATLSR
ncbi:hypothetical protein GCM10028862_03510 [Luteimonas pelagia]